jgi:hypothetical protein
MGIPAAAALQRFEHFLEASQRRFPSQFKQHVLLCPGDDVALSK